MITVGLNGRLGNEMFQIAAVIALGLKNNDDVRFNFNVTAYGEKYRKSIFSELNECVCDDYVDEHSDILKYNDNEKKVKFWGYFQSEKYFKEYKNEIIGLFSNKIILDNLYQKYKLILQNSLSLHIRRGDYLAYPGVHPCPTTDYYLDSIKYIDKIRQIDNILVFSDDISYCKSNFVDNRITFIEKQKDFEDLYLMSLCENNIIANSSFSWWGSYLNVKDDKIVVCPKKWFGVDYKGDFSDIYYENCIIL